MQTRLSNDSHLKTKPRFIGSIKKNYAGKRQKYENTLKYSILTQKNQHTSATEADQPVQNQNCYLKNLSSLSYTSNLLTMKSRVWKQQNQKFSQKFSRKISQSLDISKVQAQSQYNQKYTKYSKNLENIEKQLREEKQKQILTNNTLKNKEISLKNNSSLLHQMKKIISYQHPQKKKYFKSVKFAQQLDSFKNKLIKQIQIDRNYNTHQILYNNKKKKEVLNKIIDNSHKSNPQNLRKNIQTLRKLTQYDPKDFLEITHTTQIIDQYQNLSLESLEEEMKIISAQCQNYWQSNFAKKYQRQFIKAVYIQINQNKITRPLQITQLRKGLNMILNKNYYNADLLKLHFRLTPLIKSNFISIFSE